MVVLSVVLGCNGDPPVSDPVSELSGCDPLVPEICALPWPSSLFEAEDPGTVTGRRLSFEEHSLPANRDGKPLQPEMFERKDGFSTVGPVVVYLPDVALDGTIGHSDIDGYLAADARTVLIDTVTHERVPHWVELDMTAEDPAERVLFLRPAVPLEHARRYVVGLRNLVRTDGGPVDPSDAFRALREGEPTDQGDIEVRRQTFDELVFPELEAQGFARGELQLAWDFGTVSLESSLGPVLWMRDDALARIGDSPTYTIDTVEEGDCSPTTTEPIARTVYGHFTSPRYTEVDGPNSTLVRGEDGMPVYSGDSNVPFMARIPCSLAADPGSGGQVIQYGHGLLGNYDEARGDYLAQLADRNRWVLFAQNWIGMSSYDAGYVTLMLATDASGFEIIPDRTVQGLTEWAVGARLARGALVDDPSFVYGGQSVIDPSRPPLFYGNSQGAIVGGAYVAVSPDIERAVLGVGGLPYSLLLSRSSDFDPFFLLLNEKYEDSRDLALLLTAFQTLWDPGESGGYAYALTRDPLPGTPAKRILMQVAKGDAQVTTLGAQMAARALGAVSVSPGIRPIWGVPEEAGPVEGSAIVEWEYTDGPEEPVTNVPPDASLDVHECPRREPAAQDQLSVFLETGVVEQFCVGACVSQRAGLCD